MLGLARRSRPGVHEDRRDFVGRNVGVHRADDRQVIDISPSFGKTSLTSMPDLPCLANLKGDAMATPSWPGNAFCRRIG